MTAAIRVRTAIGLATWLASGIPTALILLSSRGTSMRGAVSWTAAFVLFGFCFWVMTRTRRRPLVLLCASSALALAVAVFGRSGFDPILLVIVAAVAGGRLSVRGLAFFIAGQCALLGVVEWMQFGIGALPSAGAYTGFMVFAAITAMIAENEKRARTDLAKANAELQTALALLDVSTRAAERARIGRDLHDVVGHHLTALSLQLEVGLHVPAEECAEHVRKAQAIAKLLLSDVRGVVGDLRTEKPIDLVRSLRLLASAIARPRMEIVAPESLLVGDPLVAQTALRSLQEIITNATRHASAERLIVRVAEVDTALQISASDDGVGVAVVEPGHGLLGMRERVEAAGGTLGLSSAPGEGFTVDIRLPLGDLG